MRVVILAGGQGTRLWPLSLDSLPKQFLKLGDRYSLLQQTVLRFNAFPTSIVTHEKYRELVLRDLKEIGKENSCDLITEPCSKNTAPAVMLALLHLAKNEKLNPNEKVLITPSDHFFSSSSFFEEDLPFLAESIEKDEIVLFGIFPSMPHTGYGYIRMGKKRGEFLSVEKFQEKPTLEKAREYLLSGKYLWNVGMSMFTATYFWQQLQKYNPEMYAFSKNGYEGFLSFYPDIPSISLDYALLENIDSMYVYPLHLGWSDVGSWDNLYQVMEKDTEKNVKKGNVLTLDTKNSFIMADKKLITTLGVEDLIIVDTKEAMFIAKKGSSQRVKEIFQKMRNLAVRKKT